MARAPRSKLPPGWFHCINRGVNRRIIFDKRDDYSWFTSSLLNYAFDCDLTIKSFCLMPNHWHIVLHCNDTKSMSHMFRKLLNAHTKYFHCKNGTIGYGPIYQGRYKSIPILDNETLQTICEYVEMNPVRANLVKNTTDWPWSSANAGTVKCLTP